MYRYLSIRSDSKYSKSVLAVDVDVFLEGCPELKKKAGWTYENNAEFPWILATAVFSDENGNYAINDTSLPKNINQIELTCLAEGRDSAQPIYHILAKKIAAHFKWEVFDSEINQCI